MQQIKVVGWALLLQTLATAVAAVRLLDGAACSISSSSSGSSPHQHEEGRPTPAGGSPWSCAVALRLSALAAAFAEGSAGLAHALAFFVCNALAVQAAALAAAPAARDVALAVLLLLAHAATLAALALAACGEAARARLERRLAGAWRVWPACARLLPGAAAALVVTACHCGGRPAAPSALLVASRSWWWAALWGLAAMLHQVCVCECVSHACVASFLFALRPHACARMHFAVSCSPIGTCASTSDHSLRTANTHIRNKQYSRSPPRPPRGCCRRP